MSSSVFPLNMHPATTSIHPVERGLCEMWALSSFAALYVFQVLTPERVGSSSVLLRTVKVLSRADSTTSISPARSMIT